MSEEDLMKKKLEQKQKEKAKEVPELDEETKKMVEAYNEELEVMLHRPKAFEMEVVGLLRQQSNLLMEVINKLSVDVNEVEEEKPKSEDRKE